MLPGLDVEVKKTWAVVVGIDRYQLGPRLNLRGPARSAGCFAAWLIGQGVPPEQVLFFRSPTAPEGGEYNERLQQLTPQEPRADQIYKVFSDGLRPGGDLLVVYWAGHGVLTADTRRLLCSDAQPRDRKNVNLESLRAFLRSENAPRFRHAVFFIDACAELPPAGAWPERTFPVEEDLPSVRQFTLVAAQRGQQAQGKSGTEIGLFSEELLAHLAGDESGYPTDLLDLARRLEKRFKKLREEGLTQQTPAYFQCNGWDPDHGFKDGTWPFPNEWLVWLQRLATDWYQRRAALLSLLGVIAVVATLLFRQPSTTEQLPIHHKTVEVPNTLAGTVLEPDTLKPVPGVKLTIQDLDNQGGSTPITETDEAGRFRFVNLPAGPKKRVHLHAQKDGYQLSITNPTLGVEDYQIDLERQP
jgi:hypothetical protein